jgi:C1A family cysteine protease
MVGGHAVCVIGFDTDFYNNPVFLKSGLEKAQAAPIMYEVRNSFGSDWGEIGHIWMPAEYLEDKNLADDAWMVVA